jgi:hypothetical protein
LKRKGWCGHLYSIPTVTSSPHTLEQWQESVTGTHTLATALWWLAYKYRSKSIYLYSPYFFQIVFMSTSSPHLFKDKQIVEGSDGCGLFVDNFFLKRLYCFAFFTVFRLVYAVFYLWIMNPDLSGLRLLSFLFQCVKVAATIFFPPKKGHKGFHIFTKLLCFFYSVTRCQN